MSLRLTLVAHAATRATRTAAFPTDEEAEPLGLARATACAPALGRVDAAWTSPARRAIQTAAALGLTATVDTALADIDLGDWAGRALTEVEATDPAGLAAWHQDPAARPHGGESVAGLLGRVACWLDGIASAEGRVVVVTHAAILRAAILVALDAPAAAFWRIDVAPLSFARFQGRAGRWTLRSLEGRPAAL